MSSPPTSFLSPAEPTPDLFFYASKPLPNIDDIISTSLANMPSVDWNYRARENARYLDHQIANNPHSYEQELAGYVADDLPFVRAAADAFSGDEDEVQWTFADNASFLRCWKSAHSQRWRQKIRAEFEQQQQEEEEQQQVEEEKQQQEEDDEHGWDRVEAEEGRQLEQELEQEEEEEEHRPDHQNHDARVPDRHPGSYPSPPAQPTGLLHHQPAVVGAAELPPSAATPHAASSGPVTDATAHATSTPAQPQCAVSSHAHTDTRGSSMTNPLPVTTSATSALKFIEHFGQRNLSRQQGQAPSFASFQQRARDGVAPSQEESPHRALARRFDALMKKHRE